MNGNQFSLRIIVAEDDIWVGREIRRLLSELGHQVVAGTTSGSETVRLVCEKKPDMIIMDIKMPDMNGIEACRIIQRQCPTPVVILTAFDTEDFLQEASESGAGAYLVKPADSTDLDRAIRIAAARFKDLEALRKSLANEKMLLNELYHRVKNNLGLIAAILRLQAETYDNEETVGALLESAGRIRTMGDLYDILHGSGKSLTVELDVYLRALTAKLRQVLIGSGGNIGLDIRADGLIEVSSEMAVYCGLIVNELVTNAFRHAFPRQSAGRIEVDLGEIGEREFRLSVRDNGRELPEDFDPRTADSLGLRLVHAFVDQIGASLEIIRSPGTEFVIRCTANARQGE